MGEAKSRRKSSVVCFGCRKESPEGSGRLYAPGTKTSGIEERSNRPKIGLTTRPIVHCKEHSSKKKKAAQRHKEGETTQMLENEMRLKGGLLFFRSYRRSAQKIHY